MLRCGANPRVICCHSNARFAQESQSFLQESRQYQCRTYNGSRRSDNPIDPQNVSGAATFCGSTKVDVRGEVHDEVNKTKQGSISKHDGRADYQTSWLDWRSRQQPWTASLHSGCRGMLIKIAVDGRRYRTDRGMEVPLQQ